MKPTPRSIQTELENFLDYLIEADIAAFVRPVSNDGSTVSWRAISPGREFLPQRGVPSIFEYKSWLKAGAYSALLYDGALLQVTYRVDGGSIVGHRLAYVPCPFDLTLDLSDDLPLLDLIDIYFAGYATDVALRTTVRFDFDPSSAATGHPAAHFTLNSVACRIACAAPLRLGHFADFVFRHFYPELWHLHPFFDGMSRKDWGRRTITEEESKRIHLFWR